MLESDMNVFDEKNEATIFCLRIGKRNSEVNEIGIGYSIFALSKCFSVDFQKKKSTSYDYSKFLDIFMTSSKIDLEKK